MLPRRVLELAIGGIRRRTHGKRRRRQACPDAPDAHHAHGQTGHSSDQRLGSTTRISDSDQRLGSATRISDSDQRLGSATRIGDSISGCLRDWDQRPRRSGEGRARGDSLRSERLRRRRAAPAQTCEARPALQSRPPPGLGGPPCNTCGPAQPPPSAAVSIDAAGGALAPPARADCAAPRCATRATTRPCPRQVKGPAFHVSQGRCRTSTSPHHFSAQSRYMKSCGRGLGRPGGRGGARRGTPPGRSPPAPRTRPSLAYPDAALSESPPHPRAALLRSQFVSPSNRKHRPHPRAAAPAR